MAPCGMCLGAIGGREGGDSSQVYDHNCGSQLVTLEVEVADEKRLN